MKKWNSSKMKESHRIDPREIRRKVIRILNNNSYKENIERLSGFQKKVDGVSRAADIIATFQ